MVSSRDNAPAQGYASSYPQIDFCTVRDQNYGPKHLARTDRNGWPLQASAYPALCGYSTPNGHGWIMTGGPIDCAECRAVAEGERADHATKMRARP